MTCDQMIGYMLNLNYYEIDEISLFYCIDNTAYYNLDFNVFGVHYHNFSFVSVRLRSIPARTLLLVTMSSSMTSTSSPILSLATSFVEGMNFSSV